MPLLGVGRQPLSLFRKEDGTIGLTGDATITLQAPDGLIYRYVCNPEAVGQIHDPRLAHRGGKIGDGLNVILGGFPGVFHACLAQVLHLRVAAFGPAQT